MTKLNLIVIKKKCTHTFYCYHKFTQILSIYKKKNFTTVFFVAIHTRKLVTGKDVCQSFTEHQPPLVSIPGMFKLAID